MTLASLTRRLVFVLTGLLLALAAAVALIILAVNTRTGEEALRQRLERILADATGARVARSKSTFCTDEASRRPCPVPILASALAASRRDSDAAGAPRAGLIGWGCSCFLRKRATPITPTLSGRPVRAA